MPKFFDTQTYDTITKKLDEAYSSPDKYAEIYDIPREQAEREIASYTNLKDAASLGDIGAREYLINQYSKFLMYFMKKNRINIDDLVDFENIQNNIIVIAFEILMNVADIGDIIKKYKIVIRVTEEEMRDIIEKEMPIIKEFLSNPMNRVKIIATLVYTREYGQDCVDTIQHHNINEIGILDMDYIYVIKGDKIHLKFLKFENEDVILNIQKKTTQDSPNNYDQHNPFLVAAKRNSSRITVAGYGCTPAHDLYYNERIFNLSKISLEEMRDSYNTIDELMCRFGCLNQKGRGSHFITGSDMGVGKSTFLLAMLEKVPDEWGIGILDTQNELQARRKYPRKNALTLIETETMDIKRCFQIMLKMARDVLYVGEITKPEEVGELINASLRLNSGVGGTLHSLSPYEVVTNLRNLMLRTDMYSDGPIAEADIARGLDTIFHLAKLPNGRIIVEYVVEVEYVEQDHYVDKIEEGTFKERIMSFLKLGQMALSKYLYTKAYKYNTIIQFDRDYDIWVPKNLPSEQYFSKIKKYMTQEEIDDFKNYFWEEKERVEKIIEERKKEMAKKV
ncbi:MAG TPA: hypothetical protein DEP72_01115 [Clostridiales bacterium]|nr:MAG: hypothetical protein A2Y18_01850 [Clostridiales bacterium GWD2_32_19]HCC06753.1 hypothetical protein [Clostridiales bacterium]